jgi:hypothetical protein
MFVCCECRVLSGRCLFDGLITRPEESYRLWHVVVCDLETSKTNRLKARYRAVENTNIMGCNARKTNNKQTKVTTNCVKQSFIQNIATFNILLTTWIK